MYTCLVSRADRPLQKTCVECTTLFLVSSVGTICPYIGNMMRLYYRDDGDPRITRTVINARWIDGHITIKNKLGTNQLTNGQ